MISSNLHGYQVNLVQTRADLDLMKSLMQKVVGIDTETTGLCYIKDKIVGYCFAGGVPIQGYYVPVRHQGYAANFDPEEIVQLAQEYHDQRKTLLFNRSFDFCMMINDGFVPKLNADHHDVQIMCWLTTNEAYPSLKEYVNTYLKIKMQTFEETAGSFVNFGYTDPTQSYRYAALDPIATVVLGRKLWDNYPYIRKIYPLDNKVSEVIRRISDVHVYLDYDKLKQELFSEEAKLRGLAQKAFSITGYEFKINSNKDKAEALSRFITLTKKTDKGAFKVNEEVLETIEHPLADVILQYVKTQKNISSYLQKLLDTKGNPVRINYKGCDVPTGRFASGGVRGNDYYAPFNIQSTPKTEVIKFIHPDPELGYCATNEQEGALGQQKIKAGIREAFIAPEGYYFVSADYQTQELVIASNLSGEDTWLSALLNGEDLHMATAKKVFHVEDPKKRSDMKTVNFASLYGANEWTIARRLKIAVDEAKRMLDLYYARLPKLTKWKESLVRMARQKGIVFTYYGRPRVLNKYYNNSDPKLWSFADRSAVNTVVQGCIPTSIMLEQKGKVSKLSAILGGRVQLADGREAVATARGSNQAMFISSRHGDFIICDTNHKLITKLSGNNYTTARVSEGLQDRVLLATLQSKKFPNLIVLAKSIFKRTSRSHIRQILKSPEHIWSRTTAAHMWNLWFGNKTLEISLMQAASLRSLASIYGFNLIKTSRISAENTAKFKLKFFRRRKARMSTMKFLEFEMVGSLTLLSGPQVYATQGFMNKNTGADVMRILLCKFFQTMEEDKEFAENSILAWHVHDEINCYIKKHYLYTFYKKLSEFMPVRNTNWVAPILPDISVGTNWGNTLVVKDVTEDNKIIPKGMYESN